MDTGTATLDFGAFPGSNEASVVITGQAGILAGSLADAWIRAEASGDHTLQDHTYAAALIGVSTGVPSAGVGFTVYGRSVEKLTGVFNIDWAWA